MPGVIVVYLGLITMFVGGVSVLKPLKFLAIDSRLQALAVVAAGLTVVVIGASLPSREVRVAAPRTQLDQFVPAYQFNEFHSVRIAAPKDKVFTALKQVTADEILFFHTLVWLRRLGRPGPESKIAETLLTDAVSLLPQEIIPPSLKEMDDARCGPAVFALYPRAIPGQSAHPSAQ